MGKKYAIREGVEKGNHLTLLVVMQISTATMENSVEIPPLLVIYTKETRIERDMCTPIFIAATARTWKQPRCPSADEWIRKRWYIYTMEYYSVIKKNTFESVLMKWMKLEPIIE